MKLPDGVDTLKLYQAALAARRRDQSRGRNGRPNKAHGSSRLRLCFASPTHEEIRAGHRGARRGMPQGVRRAGADRKRHAGARLMYVTANGARLFFDVEGLGLVPDGARMREKPTVCCCMANRASTTPCTSRRFRSSPTSRSSSITTIADRGEATAAPGTLNLAQWGDDVKGSVRCARHREADRGRHLVRRLRGAVLRARAIPTIRRS